jgi:hypothetical protein
MEIKLERMDRIIEIAELQIELDTELMLLLRSHAREVNALSARSGLSLLVGGSGSLGVECGVLLKHAEHDFHRVVAG